MSTVAKPIRAKRVNPPYSLTDPKPHIDFINTMMNQPTGAQVNELYGWVGTYEDARLWWQNNHRMDHLLSLGDLHFNYYLSLLERGVTPKKIATIGVGEDASLVENLATVFPAAAITVVEQNPKKITGARRTLETDGFSLEHISFVQGDGMAILSQLPGAFDLLDAQLLVTHLCKQPPVIWDETHQGVYPTLEKMIMTFEAAIAPGGYFMMADTSTLDWNHQAQPGCENDPEVQKLVAEANHYIYGDPGTPLGVFNLGFRNRTASTFASPEEMVATVTQYASQLQPLPEWRMSEDREYFYTCNAYYVQMMYITLTMREATNGALQLHKMIAASPSPKAAVAKAAVPRLEAALNWLSVHGQRYLEIMSDPRIRGCYPRVHWQTFRKID